MTLTIGTQLNYTGDIANQPDVATVIDIVDAEPEEGITYRVFMHTEERFEFVHENSIGNEPGQCWNVKNQELWIVTFQGIIVSGRYMKVYQTRQEVDAFIDELKMAVGKPAYLHIECVGIKTACNILNAWEMR